MAVTRQLKEMPKKGSLIRNLLQREDNQSLAVKTLEGGEILIYWETAKTVHFKASKELLDLMTKEELYDFAMIPSHSQTKRFSRGSFQFETYYPSRDIKNKPAYAKD
jgi:hypothetical protein